MTKSALGDEIGSALIAWDFSYGEDGDDDSVLLVGRKNPDGSVDIVNTFHGVLAEVIVKLLTGNPNVKLLTGDLILSR